MFASTPQRASLPAEAVIQQIIPDVEDGLSLSDVRARTKKLQDQFEMLKRVPVPAPDIEHGGRRIISVALLAAVSNG
jgi:hypothetical protein